MASQWIFLQRTNPAQLDKPFAPGQSISLVSTSYDPTPDSNAALDSAGFYFLKGDDVLLDIAVRRVQDRVLFSTRRGNSWGQEQSVALQGAFPGPGAIIHVTATATAYKISFNNSSTIHTFSKVIQGDATSILYFDNNSKPAFSNPVIAAVFDGVYILLCTLMAPVYSYTSEGNPQWLKEFAGESAHDVTKSADPKSIARVRPIG